jgi:hypothetical protein
LKRFHYRAYGIYIESELEIPELTTSSQSIPGIRIRYGNIPMDLPRITKKGILYQAYKNDFLFRVEGIGAYRVQNGNSITIEPFDNTALTEFRLFLLGSVLGAALLQKGLLLLHGSAILTKSGAIIISGDSAVGKSTIAAGLEKKGYPIITDDISAINFSEENTPYISKGVPYLKLWKDVLEYFNEKNNLERIRANLEKYKFPFADVLDNKPFKIKKLVFLSVSNSLEMQEERIIGSRKIDYVKNAIYRHQFINGLGLIETTFINVSRLASSAEALELKRPSKPLLINELIDYFERNIILE